MLQKVTMFCAVGVHGHSAGEKSGTKKWKKQGDRRHCYKRSY
jgi:hypothetical protein